MVVTVICISDKYNLLMGLNVAAAMEIERAPAGAHSSEAVTRRALSTPFTVTSAEGEPSATCGQRLADALGGTEAVIELEDGTYTHSSSFTISRNVVVRAKISGEAILDGGNTRRVMLINTGTVVIDGLQITKGHTSVCCAF